MRMLRDHILVRPDPINQHSSSLIQITSRDGIHTSREQLGRTGTVVAVGPNRSRWEDRNGPCKDVYRTQPGALKIGERVLFGEFEFKRVEDCIVLQEADVVGVIDERQGPDQGAGAASLKDGEVVDRAGEGTERTSRSLASAAAGNGSIDGEGERD